MSLSRSAGSNVTVDYATSDGTATAGADYTATSGTLTISAGSTSATVDVTVLDDSHDDGGETLTLTLSNASNGVLTDATATGTIENSDPLPKALIARVGRTAAVHIVEQVEARVNAPRAPGFDGQVAGRQITRTMGQDFALEFLQQLGGGAAYGQHHGQPDGRRNAGGGTDPPFGTGGMTSSLGPQTGIRAAMNPNGMHGLHPGGADEGGMSLGLGGEQLLGGSSVALNRATSSGGVLSFWSRSAQSQFSGQDALPTSTLAGGRRGWHGVTSWSPVRCVTAGSRWASRRRRSRRRSVCPPSRIGRGIPDGGSRRRRCSHERVRWQPIAMTMITRSFRCPCSRYSSACTSRRCERRPGTGGCR